MSTPHKGLGFTIVELLIVIVVIGILAAIVIVAYNGVQNSANETSVKADLQANMKVLSLVAVESDYPSTPASTMGLKFSKSAYDLTLKNVYYCRTPDRKDAALGIRVKNKKMFVYSTQNGLQEMTLSWSGANVCTTANLTTGTAIVGYDPANDPPWQIWAN